LLENSAISLYLKGEFFRIWMYADDGYDDFAAVLTATGPGVVLRPALSLNGRQGLAMLNSP
jgi:hypothetical protein